MFAVLSRYSARAHMRALLLTSSVFAIFSAPAMAQVSGKTTQLPEVTVQQGGAGKPAPKKVPAKKAPTPQAEVAPPEPAPAPTQDDEVKATALGSYNPALDLNGLVLPPGTTLTTAGPVQGYRALSAMSSTKTATPLEHIPQAIQVVPRSVIEDQTAISVDESLRNVSGVQGTNRLQTPAYDSTKIRGFAAEQWLDGLPVQYNAGDRDALANVERIEVLKGPSAILYGGGSGAPVGGAVNIVSKLPTNIASGELGVTVGSFGFARPYFDVNQPLSKDGTVLFRMTGEYTAADSFIEVLESERYSLNPTLTLTNKFDTTLTIQGRATRWEQQEYQGLPAFGTVTGAFRIDPDLFIGPADIPKSFSEVQGITVTLDHRFSPILSGNVKARVSRSEFAERAQSIVGADSFQANVPFVAPSTWGLTNVFLYQEQQEFTINPNLVAKFENGAMRNTLLIGADYSRVTDNGHLTADFFAGGAGTVDLSSPVFTSPYVQPPKSLFTTFQDATNEYVTKGLYVQVQTSLYDRLHLLGGLRLADIEITSFDAVAGTDDTTDKTKLLPRIGAVLDVTSSLSVFASYSEGLKANPFVNYTGKPEPEGSSQREVGAKFNFSDALTGSISYFEIERSNVPVTVGFVTTATGEQQSRGVEVDGLWQASRNWQVLANYAFVDAELARAVSGAPAGSQLIGVPEHSGRVWINYTFDPEVLQGWSVGAGIYASSGAPIDLANTFVSDSYFTVDAKIAYDSAHWAASFNVKNLTGEDYFVPYSYFGGRVAPGDERAYYGSLSYKY